MSTHTDTLRALCEDALVGGLPASLTAAIDDALSHGVPPAEIAAHARQIAPQAPLVCQAIEIYLERK